MAVLAQVTQRNTEKSVQKATEKGKDMNTIFTNENYDKMKNRLTQLKTSEYAKEIIKRVKNFNGYSEEERELLIASSELFTRNFFIYNCE